MRIFAYFLKEIIPQFFSTLIVISAVLVVSQLGRLSGVLVNFGLSAENFFLPFLYIILPLLSLTIPMAYLFAVVVSFGRLSADGEYAALLANGYSLARASIPVLLIGLVLYCASALSAVHLESWGRREFSNFIFRKSQAELDNIVKYKIQPGVFVDNFLGYVFYVEAISEDRTHFDNVLMAPGQTSSQRFTLFAPTGSLIGSVEKGDLRMVLNFGTVFSYSGEDKSSVIKFRRAEVDLLRIFQERIFSSDATKDDYRSFRSHELAAYLDQKKADPKRDNEEYLRARYLYHQRFGTPFSVIFFGLIGMVLGIQDPRRGKAQAYLGSILTVIASYIILMGFKWLGEQGKLVAPLAAWGPNVILVSFGAFLVYQRNRLPPSESTLNWKYLPWIGKGSRS